ncbi:hypothetical protein GCK72_014700 [Caenorhabditis remanei]|uniref:Uncharacterized protein n=1 Tax=Caenorhabditis remanei TaxID=31234 RepID=A0A6A5GV56_CAERE|nr:hypothetical protein GCK72_014700 [Caenorhabditis remanei]KAF1758242.1 hypothetical protein GCK72_014700 [Caenorhabditis remanei]
MATEIRIHLLKNGKNAPVSRKKPEHLTPSSLHLFLLHHNVMDGLMNATGSAAKDLENKKNGMKLLGDFSKLMMAANANDTKGTSEALVSLGTDLMKMKPQNKTNTDMGKIGTALTDILNNSTETMEYSNITQSSRQSFKDKWGWLSHKNHVSNTTDYGNNSTDFGSNGTDSLLPNFDNMSEGLGANDLSSYSHKSYPVNLNMTYSHPSVLNFFCSLTMIAFFYYVPRMAYFRLSNLSNDYKHSSFVPIVCLSVIACLGAGIHIANAYYHATNNMMVSMLTGSFDSVEFDMFSPFIYKSLTASVNRIVSPIVSLLCLQQISIHSKYNLQIFQNSFFQLAYCVIHIILVTAYSFYNEYRFMTSIDGIQYPDSIHVDLIDIILPLITAFLFFFAKHSISRQSLYTTEKYGPNGPTTLDRVSKVVVFQTIMVFVAIGAIFYSPSAAEEEVLDSDAMTWYYFFMTAQTPVVHFVLFRSLLRSRKSTRICFLVCCHSGEKIYTADNGVELNQQPRTSEPSQKNGEEEDDENKEANTMETLDHNKIVIVPDGNLER